MKDDFSFNLFTDYPQEAVASNVFAQTVSEAVSRSETAVTTVKPKKTKIEDFGEKIGGARKDMYTAYRALLADASRSEFEKKPFSQVWPRPNYLKLLEKGMEPWKVHAIRALRESAMRVISEGWRLGGRIKPLDVAPVFCELALRILDGDFKNFDEAQDSVAAKITPSAFTHSAELYLTYSILGHEQDCSKFSFYHERNYNGDEVGYTLREKRSNYYISLASGDTPEQALEEYATKRKSMPKDNKKTAKPYWKLYKVYYNRYPKPEYFIGRKVGSNLITVKRPFETVEEAFAYRNAHGEELDARFEAMKNIPNERNEENAPRTGENVRRGDVTPEEFTKAFGFRGVEFGNYVEDDRRQQDLNNAYDALMDLTNALDLPPRALSLGGKLGLAFGARGRGGKNAALAHYEPLKVVINLTKNKGAGSLGHEWFHSLDNLLAKENDLDEPFITENRVKFPHEALDKAVIALRSSIWDKTELLKRSKELDKFRTKPYWSTTREYMARSFEAYLKAKLTEKGITNDYLVNFRDEETWKEMTDSNYAYPTKKETAEIAPAFDQFFGAIEQRVEGENIVLYSASDDIKAKELENQRIPYGSMTPEELGIHAFGEKVLGIETAFYNGDPKLHGHFNPDTSTIYLNRSSELDLPWVFFHEVFHAMKDADPLLYEELKDYTGTFTAEQLNEYRRERNCPDMPDKITQEEMLADAFADYISGRRTGVVKDMAVKRPNMLRRTINFFAKVAEEVKDRFFGIKKTETESKYPKARLSKEQFNKFSQGLENMRLELRKAHNLTKGQETLLSMMASAPKLEQIHSPFVYAPEKQFAFDCKALAMLSNAFSPKAARKVIAELSPYGRVGYEAKLAAAMTSRNMPR